MPRKRKSVQSPPTPPLRVRGHRSPDPHDVKNFIQEWSLSQAEANHVETIDEANDFSIHDEEDEDFFENLTVYEMHEATEDRLALMELEKQAETNETDDTGAELNPDTTHDQSAPIEDPPAETDNSTTLSSKVRQEPNQ